MELTPEEREEFERAVKEMSQEWKRLVENAVEAWNRLIEAFADLAVYVNEKNKRDNSDERNKANHNE